MQTAQVHPIGEQCLALLAQPALQLGWFCPHQRRNRFAVVGYSRHSPDSRAARKVYA